MFLAIISNLPDNYNFYFSNHTKLQNVLKVFPIKDCNIELIIFEHYEDADDLKYNFSLMEIWSEEARKFYQIKIECLSLCIGREE